MSTTKINLQQLDPQQLMEFKKATQQELQHLQGSYEALAMAQAKYKDCIQSVESIEQCEDQSSVMVPLTSSLYVPGKIKKESFKIDIGTGYFIEKGSTESKEFFNKRINKLTEDSQKLKELVNEKLLTMQKIDSIVRQKLTAAQAQQGAGAGP